MKRKFKDWYTNELLVQFQEGIDDVAKQPVDLSLLHLKEHTAKWMVEATCHISYNPHVIVNSFIKPGFPKALDGIEETNLKMRLFMKMKVALLMTTLMTIHQPLMTMNIHPGQPLIKVIPIKVIATDSDTIILDQ